MTIEEFDNIIRDFLFQTSPSVEKVDSMELRIEIQPGMVVFGGTFIDRNGTHSPIDIRQIEKSKCRQLSNDIGLLHRSTTNDARDKWNKATYTVNSLGQISRQFI